MALVYFPSPMETILYKKKKKGDLHGFYRSRGPKIKNIR